MGCSSAAACSTVRPRRDRRRQYGGRFVPLGVRAVYASVEEETALREVALRKMTLAGERQFDVGEYPRMIYLLTISTQRNLDLTRSLEPKLEQVFAVV